MTRRAWVAAALLTVVLGAACVPPPPEGAVRSSVTADPASRARESVLRIRAVGPCGVGVGSGFVIDGGRLITNRHVVEGSRRIEVETWNGRNVGVGAARQATDTDLAVIDLTRRATRRIDPLPLAEEETTIGARLTALGYAAAGPAVATHGQFLDRRPGRRFGEPGAVMRMGTSVRPGNSGGPLLDREGSVVGVVYAYETATLLSLAVPRERLEDRLADPEAFEPVRPC